MAASVIAIDARELREWRRDLRSRADGKAWRKVYNAEVKKSGDIIASDARSRVSAMGGQGPRAATRIQAATSPAGIRIRVANTNAVPYALAFIWGIDRRTGWYAGRRFAGSDGIQHANPWVGASWEVGVAGQGPYGLNAAIAAKSGDALESWATAMQRLLVQ